MAMMSWMRRVAPYLLAGVLVAFIVSLAYFGASGRSGGQGPQEPVITVNGEAVSALAFQRAYRLAVEQYRQAFRERWSEELARSLKLQDQVVERLVSDRLLAQRAAAEGIAVTDAEVAAAVMRLPVFQEGGQFSRERYLRLLGRAQPPMTPAEFEGELREDLLRQKVQGLLAAGARVSAAEVRQHWEVERSRVRVASLLVAPAPEGDGAAAPADAELEAYHQAHPAEFTEPERRRVLVAVLAGASVPAPVVTDADVEAAYRARRAQFEQPARTRVSHILVRVPATGGSAAEDQARARAEAALQRIRGGEDFATVAREVSEDEGTAARGGDLGLVAAGELVPEVARALQGLGKGELAGPVRSGFGFHVLRVVDTVPGSKKELREVAATLRATLAAEGALRALRDRAQEVQQALLAAGDFAAEARARGLAVREAGPLRRGEAVEGVGRVPELDEAIFALPPGGVSAPVRVPEGYAVVRLLEHQPSRLRPLAEARSDVARAVRRQRADEAARARAQSLADELRKGADARAAARASGAAYAEVGPFSRAEPLGDRALGQAIGPTALALPPGGVAGPVPGPGGHYVVKLLSREAPDPAEFERARGELERRLTQERRTQLWQDWLAAARATAKIEVNRRLLPEG